MKTVFVTGGSGFIGSNLINYLLKRKTVKIVNIDKLTYASNKNFILSNNPLYRHYKIDIKNKKKIDTLFDKHKPHLIINLAAETHVDNSIIKPDAFINTNIIGTFNLLLASKRYIDNNLFFKNKFKFIHISTDEVFGDIGFLKKSSIENDPYRPNSPYSASKASSDHLVRAWIKTYKFPAIITNCGNNYGPFQHKEKLIPKVIINSLLFLPIPIYSNGRQIRDWIFVEDHVRAILHLTRFGKLGESYNIGASNEISNINVVKKICQKLDYLYPSQNKKYKSYSDLITYVKDRPGHDQRYALNTSKIKKINWKPITAFETGIDKTIKFYIKKINE